MYTKAFIRICFAAYHKLYSGDNQKKTLDIYGDDLIDEKDMEGLHGSQNPAADKKAQISQAAAYDMHDIYYGFL